MPKIVSDQLCFVAAHAGSTLKIKYPYDPASERSGYFVIPVERSGYRDLLFATEIPAGVYPCEGGDRNG